MSKITVALLGYSRNELLEELPDIKDLVEENEAQFGLLQRYICVPFKDGRKTLFVRYENACVLEFRNLEGEDSRFALSREAMTSLFISYQFTQTPEDLAKDYEHFKEF